MKLSALLKDLPALAEPAPPTAAAVEIQSIAFDSRRVSPGALFFALPGARQDGASFAREAIRQGAVAIVSDHEMPGLEIPNLVVSDARSFLAAAAARFHNNPSRKLKIVGVTGTNGKTTTTSLIKHLLDEASLPCGLIGTIAYSLGREELPASRTTPEALDNQDLLARMLAAGCKACAMEVSSHALVQHRVDHIEFDAAVFTNLTQDHLDYHGDMESYFSAKALLFDKLRLRSAGPGRAIINIDDRFGRRLTDRIPSSIPVITTGLTARADFRASKIQFSHTGTTFALSARGRDYLVRLPLIGLFNVHNALAALAAAAALGCEVRRLVAALARAPQIPGRLQRVPAKRNFQVFVDYAHTPDAVENALKTLRELHPARLLCVVGCGGDRDATKRPLMARAAESLADHVVLTSDNPRSEDPAKILSEMQKGLLGSHYDIIENREAAIRHAINLAAPGDIVLLAGKGHETYQEVAGERLPFDDVTVAGWAINEKPIPAE